VSTLKDILFGASIKTVVGSTERTISALSFDSRTVTVQGCFVAIHGLQVDGHHYIEKALALGVIAVVCEQLPDDIQAGITYIQVANSSDALAVMASNFYHQPSRDLKLIGITGTNGKTTIASLL